MGNVQHMQVGVILEDGAANLSELVACQAEAVQAVEVLQLVGQHGPDPVLPQVEGPQLGEGGDVLRDGVQVVVVEGEVLQQRGALQEAGGGGGPVCCGPGRGRRGR